MVKWNPFNNTRQTGDQDIASNDTNNGLSAMSSNQNHEQDSAYTGQTSSNAEPQREPTNVLPSDFGGYLIHPENKTNQTSDFMHGSDDMVARKDPTTANSKKTTSPPGYASNPELTHDEDISFFGDSNTTELHATSRSTLDQAGLHRGSISTLPSAGDHRRGSAQSSGRRDSLNNERRGSAHQRGVPISGLGGAHAPESATAATAGANVPITGNMLPVDNKVSALPSDKLSSVDESKQESDATARKSSLTGIASAAVTGVAAAASGAAAAILGTGHQQTSANDEATSKMPSAWPDAQNSGYILQKDSGKKEPIMKDAIKKDATNCTHEPSIHGQTPCFYTKDNICDEKHEDLNTHCEQVREPSIHGQNPSFFCDKKQSSGSSDARDAIKSSAITSNDLTRSDSINTHPANAQDFGSSNSGGLYDSKGIDSDAITAGSDQTESHRHLGAAAAATAAIGTGAGIAAFNREPIDAEAIRRHSLDNSKDGSQNEGLTSTEKMGDGYILDKEQARKSSTDSGLHGIHDSTSATTGSHAIPASELSQPIKRTDLGESTLNEGQVPKINIAAAGPATATAAASTSPINNPADKQTAYSVDRAQSNSIADVYRNNAQGTTANMITPENPEVQYKENNINDVYRNDAQAVDNNMVVPDNPNPTTANAVNNVGDVYRGNAQGTAANMVTAGNPTVEYQRNNIKDVYSTTPRDSTPENLTPQYKQTPKDSVQDSSNSNTAKDVAAGGGIAAALGGLLGLHHKGSVQSKASAGSEDSSNLGRTNRIATPESNDINAVYQTNAQDAHSNQITRDNPVFDDDRNNLDDVYRTNAQGAHSDQVSERNPTPTTAVCENDIRDVYRTNAEGATQNLISPGNPTTNYKTNDISDVYRTTPRNLTPANSTPHYIETPKQGSSHKHDSLLATGGIAAAVGGILGAKHHGEGKHDQDSLGNSSNDTALHADKLPLNHSVDQKPSSEAPIDNNAYPQQMHNTASTRVDSTLHHDKLPLGQAIDQQPLSNTLMDNNSHPQQMHSAAALPEDRATDSLHPQTGSQGPAPFVAGNTANSNLPGNLEQTREAPVTVNHRQTGTMDSAPIGSGLSDPAHAQSLNPQVQGAVGAAPIIASSTGVPVPGNINRSKGSFSSTRAITDNIVPSPAAGGALFSRPDEVKDRSLDRENQIKQSDPKRKGSLTDGIKSAFRRMSLKSDKKANKDGRRLSAAEAFKKQTLTNNDKSKSAPITATTANIAGSNPANSTSVSGSDAAPIASAHQTQQHPAPGGFIINNNEDSTASGPTNQNYARVPGVYSLKPVGTANVADNGEINFIKLNEEANNSAPTKSTLSAGKSEHRRGSIQNTIGKIIGSKNMQDKGTLSQVSGKEKMNAYNSQTHPTNLNNL
ncbi:hypothetical protein MAM1_0261d08869 [Mucor ambiguus]|uniref:Uncharacterized protein n=1 Tax=Mucor ambiguus TaxID=91626 RepID=A0A0C9N443_9FUNG|nr:hypothetical protein MAM1_0261d08869 [Mucor ambiguus]